MKKKIYLILTALASIFVLAACNKVKAPEYLAMENFRLKKAGMPESVIGLDLKCYNPNRMKMKLDNASLDIYINNKYVGHAILDNSIDVPKKDTFYIPLSVTTQLKQVFSNAVNLLFQPEVLVGLKGNAKVGKGGVFVNMPIDYQGKQRVDLLKSDSSFNDVLHRLQVSDNN